jgi:F-type H+-transporting ATPase subunit delta
MQDPILRDSQKIIIIDTLFAKKLNSLTVDFLKLLVKNKREGYIEEICRSYLDIYRKNHNIKSAVITTAKALDKTIQQEIETMIKNTFQAKVEMEEKVDKSLIGGFVLRIDNKQFDASIASQLNSIKRTLKSRTS